MCANVCAIETCFAKELWHARQRLRKSSIFQCARRSRYEPDAVLSSYFTTYIHHYSVRIGRFALVGREIFQVASQPDGLNVRPARRGVIPGQKVFGNGSIDRKQRSTQRESTRQAARRIEGKGKRAANAIRRFVPLRLISKSLAATEHAIRGQHVAFKQRRA
jgi:hypothetical protein